MPLDEVAYATLSDPTRVLIGSYRGFKRNLTGYYLEPYGVLGGCYREFKWSKGWCCVEKHCCVSASQPEVATDSVSVEVVAGLKLLRVEPVASASCEVL